MKRLTRWLGISGVACVAVVLGLAAPVVASKPPSKKAGKKIAKVFDVPRKCLTIRVSTVDRRYAFSKFKAEPPRSCIRFGFDGIAVLHLARGKWKPVFEGSSFTCADVNAPETVKSDLRVPGC